MRSQATRIIVRNHNWGHAAVVLISQRSDCNRSGNSSAAREQGHPQAVAKSIRSPADRLSNEHATRQRAHNPPKDAHPDPSDRDFVRDARLGRSVPEMQRAGSRTVCRPLGLAC